jgi:hypothetical protein
MCRRTSVGIPREQGGAGYKAAIETISPAAADNALGVTVPSTTRSSCEQCEDDSTDRGNLLRGRKKGKKRDYIGEFVLIDIPGAQVRLLRGYRAQAAQGFDIGKGDAGSSN